jgi:heme/copper-type cytochrome/quinol oxidase subunit 4
MPEEAIGRINGDLDVIHRAKGLRLSFGHEMLGFGIMLALTATGAAVVSLLMENDWIQVMPLAAIMVLVPVGLFLRLHRTSNVNHEINLQVLVSVVIYAVVWIAACGYALAAVMRDTIGAARTAALYAASIGILLVFTLMLVCSALMSRERYYCLGLAISTLLAGMLLPVTNPHYSYPIAHCLMAVGYLTVVAIQWVQLRDG